MPPSHVEVALSHDERCDLASEGPSSPGLRDLLDIVSGIDRYLAEHDL